MNKFSLVCYLKIIYKNLSFYWVWGKKNEEKRGKGNGKEEKERKGKRERKKPHKKTVSEMLLKNLRGDLEADLFRA